MGGGCCTPYSYHRGATLQLPDGATIQMAAGNHVVVYLGQGSFAFYDHMQPGSVKVKVGDKVTTGQVPRSARQ
jgi:murein DD-endopeptidase MepM/ murein hydrolase activator NlpD